MRERHASSDSSAAPRAQDLKLGPWVSEAAPAAGGAGAGGAYDLFALAAHQHDPKLAYPSDDRQGRLVRPCLDKGLQHAARALRRSWACAKHRLKTREVEHRLLAGGQACGRQLLPRRSPPRGAAGTTCSVADRLFKSMQGQTGISVCCFFLSHNSAVPLPVLPSALRASALG